MGGTVTISISVGERMRHPIPKARHYPSLLFLNGSGDKLLNLFPGHAWESHCHSVPWVTTLIGMGNNSRWGTYKGTGWGFDVVSSVRCCYAERATRVVARRSLLSSNSSRATMNARVRNASGRHRSSRRRNMQLCWARHYLLGLRRCSRLRLLGKCRYNRRYLPEPTTSPL